MRFAFQNQLIRTICEDHDEATNAYGAAVSQVLKTRLADLRAAASIADLPSGNPMVVPAKPYSFYKVDLAESLQLIFAASHINKPPLNEGNDIDWPRVNYIQIIEIR